jgi:hypothetical protein
MKKAGFSHRFTRCVLATSWNEPPEVLRGINPSPRCGSGQVWRDLSARLGLARLGGRFSHRLVTIAA